MCVGSRKNVLGYIAEGQSKAGRFTKAMETIDIIADPDYRTDTNIDINDQFAQFLEIARRSEHLNSRNEPTMKIALVRAQSVLV